MLLETCPITRARHAAKLERSALWFTHRAWKSRSAAPSLLRPLAVDDRFRCELRRIDDYVPDALAFPCVGEMHEAVARLDHSGIRILTRLGFQHQSGFPRLAVARDGDVQGRAAF